MIDVRVRQKNFWSLPAAEVSQLRNVRTSFKSMLSEKSAAAETFDVMWQSTLEKYFGQPAQSFCHVMDATNISLEVWEHNDFPYEKFLADTVDESVLNWTPTRANPSQLNSEVQRKLTATLGKHAIVIPSELAAKLQTDSALRQKVIANVEELYKFHVQPPSFKIPGVKEYGMKIFGSVTILNAKGDVENCVVTSGGTITGPDEETLRQIEVERKRKLRRKEFNAELSEQAQLRYLTNREVILSE